MRKIDEHIEEYKRQIIELSRTIRTLEIAKNNIQARPAGSEKRDFIRKCPVTDCRGFLSTRSEGTCACPRLPLHRSRPGNRTRRSPAPAAPAAR
jgi:hypothetical protein